MVHLLWLISLALGIVSLTVGLFAWGLQRADSDGRYGDDD